MLLFFEESWVFCKISDKKWVLQRCLEPGKTGKAIISIDIDGFGIKQLVKNLQGRCKVRFNKVF